MTIVARVIGGIVSLGLLLGVIWGGCKPVISLAPPLLLLVLISFPERMVCKYFSMFVIVFLLSVISLFINGFPFINTGKSIDIDIIDSVQWLLIVYFLLLAKMNGNGKGSD